MKRISGNADDIKDKKDRVKKDGYNRGQHCIYCLTYHMIFVTHYRKPVINEEMSSAMKEFSNHMAEQFRGKILSAETDRDHIHLLVSLPPNTNVSVFVRSIKTQLSREMRKRFPEQIKQYIYGDDTSFWSRSYFIATTGSVSLETLSEPDNKINPARLFFIYQNRFFQTFLSCLAAVACCLRTTECRDAPHM